MKQASPEPLQGFSTCSSLHELATLLETSTPHSIIDLGGRILSGDAPSAAGGLLAITTPGLTLRKGKLRLTGAQRMLVTGAAVGVTFEDLDIVEASAAGEDSLKDVVTVEGVGLKMVRCTVTSTFNVQHLIRLDKKSTLQLRECRLQGGSR